MTGFITRLKQRKLVQWALAYVAFAFALLQGVDIVAQRSDCRKPAVSILRPQTSHAPPQACAPRPACCRP